ncbi:MAG: hypothetical protein B0D92_08325 [Spirochaeta sp. LUC14_002_19_P3]|nr:MAG: hypothetical protein B0D92_08325 [Spirochaeta sp. LUC14_002_19_P3]
MSEKELEGIQEADTARGTECGTREKDSNWDCRSATRKKTCGTDSWWEERRICEKVVIAIGLAILGLGFFSLVILFTKLLWNKLMPEIFGISQISYWQTAGLMLLSCIFFSRLGGSDKNSGKERKRKRELKRSMEHAAQQGETDSE